MDAVPRWILVLVVLALFVGFVAFARGRPHHRGPQQVGAVAYGPTLAPSALQRSDV